MRIQPVEPYSRTSLYTQKQGDGPLSSLTAARQQSSSALSGLWAADEASTSALSGLWAAGGEGSSALSTLWAMADSASSALDGLRPNSDEPSALDSLWSASTGETAAPGERAARAAANGAAASSAGGSTAGEIARSMGYAATAARSGMRGDNNLAELYRFVNQYYYGTSSQTWAKLDTDGDGVWSKAELQEYADAYEKATGRALDVDALWQKYVVDAGRTALDYNAQQEMYADDALGISYAKDALIAAEYDQGFSSGKPNINQSAFDEFVSKYTYGTAGKLYAAIDKNEDGVWTLDELTAYADAYYKATGVKLDVEALMAKYDKEGKGYLNYYDQNDMYRDDALGLSRISDHMKAGQESGKDKIDDNSLAQKITESKNSLSNSDLWKVAGALAQSMQKAAMLDMFMLANFSIYGRGAYRNNFGMYSQWNAFNMGIGVGYLLR